MINQLHKLLDFWHKGCGGQIKQAAHPTVTPAYPGAGQPLKYFCIGCQKYVEPEDVADTKEEADKAKPVAKPVAVQPKPSIVPPKPAVGPVTPAVVPPVLPQGGPPGTFPKPPESIDLTSDATTAASGEPVKGTT